ncbi:HupE/UreJ family protein [Chondrinema litorale]|uniref:HupE/UreJ family protein n=1 Tax=Chondrinema litorale TaxID=2994555 RepID=UPI000C695550|nr:HupE/UreJ family protein [Chondrinema litorale]MBT28578.1 HupE / UreJ protein [Thalassovita sp.]UZR92919.1 HupE/UreJ family protein [Chondrinema litorale]
MSEFQLFLQMGFEHISDPNGYDHILFILALCAVYQPADWKQVLVLVTAFTLGHSITLALATMQLVNVNGELIEFLIPVTIFLTAVFNYFHDSKKTVQKINQRYFVALFFGLIHGLGFSNYLRSLLGKDESIFTQLLAFNIGLELGQLMIVAIIMLFTFLFGNIGNVKKREWNLLLSGAAGGIAFIMMLERNIFF